MKKFLIGAFVAAAVLCFTGCYDAIYQSIRNEVELEEGTINGFVSNIARFNVGGKEFLFTTNGLVYYKDANAHKHGAWNKVSGNGLPGSLKYVYDDTKFKGLHFSKVVADADTVYLMGFRTVYIDEHNRNQPGEIMIYYAKPVLAADGESLDFSSGWEKANALNEEIKKYLKGLDEDNFRMDASIHLFGTNSYNADHRKAYLRIGGGAPVENNVENRNWSIYELKGDSMEGLSALKKCEVDSDGNETVTGLSNKELNRYTLSAVYFNSDYHFLNTLNAETNDGTGSSSEYVYFSDGGAYQSNGRNFCWFKAEDYDTVTVNVLKDQSFKKSLETDSIPGDSDYESMNAFQAYLLGLKSLVVEKDEDGITVKDWKVEVVKPEKLKSISNDIPAPIISLAVTKDSILLGTGYNRTTESSNGTKCGIFRLFHDDSGNVTSTKCEDFESNAYNVMVSPYYVRALICANPGLPEKETDLYSSVDYPLTVGSVGANKDNRGLWSYYPGRGNWNRE